MRRRYVRAARGVSSDEFMCVLRIGLTAESPFLCVGKCTRLLLPARRRYVASTNVLCVVVAFLEEPADGGALGHGRGRASEWANL